MKSKQPKTYGPKPGLKKFPDPKLSVLCCGHVFRGERPAFLVSREGSEWQFVCGGVDHGDEEPQSVPVGQLLATDPTLEQVADLPAEWEAERGDLGGQWIRTKSLPQP